MAAAAVATSIHHLLLLTFGILGNIVSICVYFAPMATFIEICRKKSTMGYQSLPYVVALFSAKVWMYYALLKTKAILLISINSFGCIIETIYIIIFLLYASKHTRKQTMKVVAFLNVGVFGSILVSTFFLVPPSSRVRVVGWIAVAISIAVFAAPLNIVFQVVRTRSVEFMPFTLSFSLTISAVTWFTYGVMLFDWYVAFPNVIGFFLGLVQMVLYGVYKNGKKLEAGVAAPGEELVIKKLAAVPILIQNNNNNNNPDQYHQVHPIDVHSTTNSDGTTRERDGDHNNSIDHDHIVVVLDHPQLQDINIPEPMFNN